jgi:hypothetical protein
MTDLERHLNELGVIARPAPLPAPALPARPEGPPSSWRGIWYPDGNVPF